MSRLINQELSSWKDVLVRLRRIETRWRGISLSSGDHQTWTEGILLNSMVVSDLSNRYEGFGTHVDHVNLAFNMCQLDVDDVARFLSAAIVAWRRMSSPEAFAAVASYAGFKRLLSKDFPFAGVILGPIKEAISFHLEDQSSRSFSPVYQYFSFLTHLTLNDIDLSVELEAGYLEQEERLAAFQLHDGLIEQMNFVMRDWMSGFKIKSEDFLPEHGPGGVADLLGNSTLENKYKALRPNAMIKYVLKKHIGIDALDYCPAPLAEGETSRTSRIVFVSKSMNKKRVISAEPTTYIYFEKAIDNEIRKWIRNHDYLSQHIDFNNQCVQRQAALDASRTRKFATVDLSAASDSISFDLVKDVFRGTALYPFLVAFRSNSAKLPSKRIVSLAKFAPMGSALAFPIQTLIFACVVECTVRYVRATGGISPSAYRVYGDDIIAPDICLNDLVVNLHRCGFTINRGKTYGGNQRFRESCGCDAYDGGDVSPMRISRNYQAIGLTSRTPSAFAGLCKLANQAALFNFPLLRRFLIDKLVNGNSFIPQFSADDRIGVSSPIPDNYRLPKVRNDDLQRTEIFAAGVHSVQAEEGRINWSQRAGGYECPDLDTRNSDDIRYFEWLRSTYCRTGDPHDPDAAVSISIGSAGTWLAKRWVSDPPLIESLSQKNSL